MNEDTNQMLNDVEARLKLARQHQHGAASDECLADLIFCVDTLKKIEESNAMFLYNMQGTLEKLTANFVTVDAFKEQIAKMPSQYEVQQLSDRINTIETDIS